MVVFRTLVPELDGGEVTPGSIQGRSTDGDQSKDPTLQSVLHRPFFRNRSGSRSSRPRVLPGVPDSQLGPVSDQRR